MKISALVFAVGSFVFAAQSALAVNPFSLPWVNGPARDSVYHTADHADGIFILEAFQNFCPHCHNNAPAVDALYTKYKDQARVQVLDLDLDTDQSEVTAWIDQYHPAYPVIQDSSREVWNQLGGDGGIPMTVVMDCKGNIKYTTEGEWDDGAKADIAKAIDALLATPCAAN